MHKFWLDALTWWLGMRILTWESYNMCKVSSVHDDKARKGKYVRSDTDKLLGMNNLLRSSICGQIL